MLLQLERVSLVGRIFLTSFLLRIRKQKLILLTMTGKNTGGTRLTRMGKKPNQKLRKI
jgi:hypothetical protein